jgi:hypothetical protein
VDPNAARIEDQSFFAVTDCLNRAPGSGRRGRVDNSSCIARNKSSREEGRHSQGELDTELEVSFRNDFLKREACRQIVEVSDRVGAMLYRLHDSLD